MNTTRKGKGVKWNGKEENEKKGKGLCKTGSQTSKDGRKEERKEGEWGLRVGTLSGGLRVGLRGYKCGWVKVEVYKSLPVERGQ